MSKKNKTEYPSGSRTSWKVVITYLFVLALCAALFYYISNLRKSIENQRSNIDTQHNALNWVNEFTKNVHAAQNAANLYAFTEQAQYKREFNAYCNAINVQTDSLLLFRSGGEAGEKTKEGSSLSPEDHVVIPSKVLKNYLNEEKYYCKMPFRGNKLCGLLSTGC